MKRVYGRNLETLILTSQQGVLLQQCHSAVKYLPGGKMVKLKATCDFFGLLTDGTARLVFLDAKECRLATRFPIGDRTHIHPHQVEQLIRFGRAGALAGLLVEQPADRRLYWVPWRWLVRPPPSLQWSEMLDVGTSKMAIDWGRIVKEDALDAVGVKVAG